MWSGSSKILSSLPCDSLTIEVATQQVFRDAQIKQQQQQQQLLLLLLLLFTAIGLPPGGSGYFTCIQNMKLVTNKFKSGGLHEKHVVATWNLGNHLSISL